MRRIGVLTSGGDAPGMNACLRAVVRAAAYRDWQVLGVRRGFTGLISGKAHPLGPRDVSNIIQRGGTILGTSRCEAFLAVEGRAKAIGFLEKQRVEALVVVGGDGTFRGAQALAQESGLPIIGVPGTIDNDIFGTDETIGYDTAINTALEAIDKLRDTAASHSRVFFVEVMGRRSGFIALATAIGGGAEEIIIPEEVCDIRTIGERIQAGLARGKGSSIVVVAEGDELGGAERIARAFQENLGLEVRTTVLGHVQRGGAPTARDRVLASRLGAFAIDGLADGLYGVMAGEIGGRLQFTPLADTWSKKKDIDRTLLDLARILAT
jgi:6-phosphofructokinase 1